MIGLPATANAAEGPEADPATSAPVIVVTPAPAPATSPGMALMPAPAPAAAPPPPAYQPAVPGTNAPSPMLVDPRIAALKHQRAAGLGMTISGFTMFGTSYLLSALVGSISLDYAADVGGSGTYGRRMLVPVVGPFMAIPRTGSATGGLFTGLLGVVQVGGLVLGTSGAIKLGRANRQLALSADAGGIQLKF
ncbi:hypothetical protein G6O69_32690 [Pseudenhygromyxa sp. WMMC2535]|uniref:hypothetical protein n=1 Tax=Pseudenhygromyxa sp. WMMC2535 TaxID=2712867 RepID=UPI001595B8FF|nr:hypothetical protein [Pseudenhygromyxa sp. WMMC2535]NVB42626.1 hypothetical protein [Pseudenhygromyxa sp. WMMC2535]